MVASQCTERPSVCCTHILPDAIFCVIFRCNLGYDNVYSLRKPKVFALQILQRYLTKEGRIRKFFHCFVWIKEPCVRKFEGLERSKLLGISQTMYWVSQKMYLTLTLYFEATTAITWRSGYCYLNKDECNLNQSKYNSIVERVAYNNS